MVVDGALNGELFLEYVNKIFFLFDRHSPTNLKNQSEKRGIGTLPTRSKNVLEIRLQHQMLRNLHLVKTLKRRFRGVRQFFIFPIARTETDCSTANPNDIIRSGIQKPPIGQSTIHASA